MVQIPLSAKKQRLGLALQRWCGIHTILLYSDEEAKKREKV
jgi:hypothetical protein